MNWHCQAKCASPAVSSMEWDGQRAEGAIFLLVQPLDTGQNRGPSNPMTSDKMLAHFSL